VPASPAHSAAGKVRIIAGSLRGSRLAVPDVPGLRPTPDRVRETLFNWLAPCIAGARCLDAFAGSGALGIEALSRGAGEVVFIERDPALAAALQANLERLRQVRGRVIVGDALAELPQLAPGFDLVFLDPPFALGLWSEAARAIGRGGLLRPGALVYVEAPIDAVLALPEDWHVHREGRAGGVRFALYRPAAGIR